MKYRMLLFGAAVNSALLLGQTAIGPVINPRGVTNALARHPAPATAGRGGLIRIEGLNLGPAAELKAEGVWPFNLGGVEVLINGRAAPVGFVSPGVILAQIPFEQPPGPAQIVVRRNDASSRPARIQVNNTVPSLRSQNGLGFGEGPVQNGTSVTLTGSGFGLTEPRLGSGELASTDGANTPAQPVRAFVGGLPAVVTSASHSTTQAGQFDIKTEVPAGAKPGDVVTVLLGNQPPANRVTLGGFRSPEVLYVRLPEGTPTLRAIDTADLRGTFAIASGARDANGCYPAYLFDLPRNKAGLLDSCLTAGNRNALSAAVPVNESGMMAALVGPPAGEAPNGVSAKVKIASPASDDIKTVELPSPAIGLASGPGGMLLAPTGARTFSINPSTGEVEELQAGGGGGLGGVLLNLQIDLGDGLDKEISFPAQVAPNVFAVVIGDHQDDPQKARLALVSPQGEVNGTRAFPDGWIPFVPPRPPQAPPGGGVIIRPGEPGMPGVALLNFRVPVFTDPQARAFYVLARRADDSRHGVVSFNVTEDQERKAIEMPAGWYAAGCVPNLAFQSLELSRRIALFIDKTPERQFRNPCPAQGFLLMDLQSQTLSAVSLPGQGAMNAAVAPPDLNDFVYATNTDATRQGTSDVLFVLDGVTATAYRFDPPPDVASFSNLVRLPDLNSLAGLARNRAPGDAGLVIFDLERIETRVLPTPEGFASVQFAGYLPVTRKVVARGVRAGNSGTQFLIYDPSNGDLQIVPNPEGVAFVGQPPPQAPVQPPGPGGGAPMQALQAQDVSAKSNTVTAIAYNSERQQVGVIAVRVH